MTVYLDIYMLIKIKQSMEKFLLSIMEQKYQIIYQLI